MGKLVGSTLLRFMQKLTKLCAKDLASMFQQEVLMTTDALTGLGKPRIRP